MNSALEMEIKGYQFPEEERGNNANWLIVALKVSYNGDYWEVDYPLLSTQRLIDFRNWIESISNGECKRRDFIFSKSDISFSYLGKVEQSYKLRILLKYGCLPQEFNFNSSVDNSSVFINSLLALDDLTSLISLLQQDIINFPVKQ
jgi:hypothetical protein